MGSIPQARVRSWKERFEAPLFFGWLVWAGFAYVSLVTKWFALGENPLFRLVALVSVVGSLVLFCFGIFV